MYRYQEIYRELKSNILNNLYPEGHLLPSQEELAKKYNVSRLTIKKSLTKLIEEGLIDSRPGIGTTIRYRLQNKSDEILPLDAPIGATYSHRLQDVKSKILSFSARLPSEHEQKNLNLNSTDAVYEIKRVRLINNNKYSFEYTIMPASIKLDAQILEGSIYDYLGKEYGIKLTDARRVIYAQSADQESSKALSINIGEALLVIEQTAYDQNGKAFEFSTSKFANDYSKFAIDVHRQN